MGFDRRLQRYLRATAARGRDVVRCGPFVALLHPADPLRYRNYAVPEEDATFGIEDARALASVFRGRGRLPRLEFVESEAPGLAAVLEAAGYELEARLDLMTCTPPGLLSPAGPAGLRLELVDASSPQPLRRRPVATQRACFGQPGGGGGGVGASLRPL